MDSTKFKKSCKETLSTFLSGYTSERKYFDKERLSRARVMDKQFFGDQSREANHKIFVRWFLEDGKVQVVGTVQDVELKMTEIVDRIETLAPR